MTRNIKHKCASELVTMAVALHVLRLANTQPCRDDYLPMYIYNHIETGAINPNEIK